MNAYNKCVFPFCPSTNATRKAAAKTTLSIVAANVQHVQQKLQQKHQNISTGTLKTPPADQ
jgi:hypothetical protein